MIDLDIAKKRLHTELAALAIVKEGEIIFETRSRRISGFLEAIDLLGPKLENACIADRIVGKAVALLCVYVRARAVYADVLSRKGKALLDSKGIVCEWNDLVENILDLSKSKLCPFEQAAEDVSDAVEAYGVFKELQRTLDFRD